MKNNFLPQAGHWDVPKLPTVATIFNSIYKNTKSYKGGKIHG